MRVSIAIVLFLVFFNAAAGMLMSTGVAGDLGIDTGVGNDEGVEAAQDAAENVDPGTGGGGTLFGLYSALAGTLTTILETIFPGAAMLKAVGVPDFIVDFLFTAMSIIVALDLIAFLRGYELI